MNIIEITSAEELKQFRNWKDNSYLIEKAPSIGVVLSGKDKNGLVNPTYQGKQVLRYVVYAENILINKICILTACGQQIGIQRSANHNY